jgi:hypothetical protein
MNADGYKFYLSENGVCLTDEAPVKYLERIRGETLIDLHLHTNRSDDSDSPLELLEKAEAADCAAIEVYHSLHAAKEISEYGKIAFQNGLLVSGGSDYHGRHKNVKIGQLTADGVYPDDDSITILERV